MQAYGYLIRVDRKRLYYSGDIAGSADITPHLIKIDILICEGYHIDFEELVGVCVSKRVKRLVLTHLSDNDFNNSHKLHKIARQGGLDKLVIAKDGLRLKI